VSGCESRTEASEAALALRNSCSVSLTALDLEDSRRLRFCCDPALPLPPAPLPPLLPLPPAPPCSEGDRDDEADLGGLRCDDLTSIAALATRSCAWLAGGAPERGFALAADETGELLGCQGAASPFKLIVVVAAVEPVAVWRGRAADVLGCGEALVPGGEMMTLRVYGAGTMGSSDESRRPAKPRLGGCCWCCCCCCSVKPDGGATGDVEKAEKS